MKNNENDQIKEAIEDCIRRICPVTDLYLTIAQKVDSKKMKVTLDSACAAICELISMIPGADKGYYCPSWQVMIAICADCGKKSKHKSDKK